MGLLFYVCGSWPLRCGLPNSLYGHLTGRARWAFGLCMWKLATSGWASVRCMASSHVDFSTVYEVNAWVKRCYCSVDEIVQLFRQALLAEGS